jgi:anti-anti-sigma factor
MWGKLDVERVESERPEVVTYRLTGMLSYSADGNALVESMKKDLAGGRTKIVVSLEKLERIDSGGLGLLCAALASVRNVGGKLVLVGVGPRYHQLFKATRLLDVFPMFETEEELQLD